MSSLFTNVHVKSHDTQSVCDAFRSKGFLPGYFSQVESGWLSIYPKRTENLDSEELDPEGDIDELMQKACCLASSAGKSVAIAFANYDGVVCYWLANGGELLDVYSSDPEECGKDPCQWRGKPAVLLPFCKVGTAEQELENLLFHGKGKPAELSAVEEQQALAKIESEKKALLTKYAVIAQLPPERVKEKVPDIDEMLNFLERDLRAAYRLNDDLPTAEDKLSALAEFLGISSWRATSGFNYIVEEDDRGDTEQGEASVTVALLH